MVALIALATGVMRDLATGPYQGKETGETALFRALWEALEAGDKGAVQWPSPRRR